VIVLFGLALVMTGVGIIGLATAVEMPSIILEAIVIITSIVVPTVAWMLFAEALRRYLEDDH
jgi:hypothetical protein